MAITIRGGGGENVKPEVTEQDLLIEELEAILAKKYIKAKVIDNGDGGVAFSGVTIQTA